MTGATFLVYRNGGSDLERRIMAALATYRKRQGQEPAAVTVHKSEVAKVRALGLALEVRGCGGCLVGETWLELPERGGGDVDPRGDLEQGELWEMGP